MSHKSTLKQTLIVFLQTMTVLAGITAFVFMLLEPRLEGRNIHATLFETYFEDLFLAYAYIASIPFFIALHKIFNVLEHIKQDTASSQVAIRSLRTVRRCALLMLCFVAIGEVFIILNESDDRAGGVFMGVLVASGSIVMITVARLFERVYTKR